ncbi:MAG: hypothetical protein ACXADY_16905 [Candidatus Hodarchaeales archaeon]
MVKGRSSFKRFILTILEKMPSFIEKYPKNDRILLTEFLNVLQFHEVEKFENRMLFSRHSEAFIGKYHLKHKKYYELPFLWFAIDYFNIANRILSAEGFHADQFNQYLVNFLRDESRIQGVFGLVRDTTPLINLKWEILQYSCNKFTVPLIQDQLLILESVFSLIPKAGLKNLTQQRLKTEVVNKRKKVQTGKRKKRMKPRELQRLFTLLDAQWNLRFCLSTLDLGRLYFHLQLSDSNQLPEILGYKETGNTTLTASTVYRERNFNNYLGILLLPIEMMRPMEIHLKRCEEKRKIKLHEVSKIIDIQMSRSLKLYEAGKGWRTLGSKEKRKLNQNPKTVNNTNKKNSTTQFVSPRFYTDWHFQQDGEHNTPSQFIDLYCKAVPAFSFDDLQYSDPSKKKHSRFSKPEQDMLSYLYKEEVIQIDFNPIRLMSDFSLNEFWIEIPSNVQQDHLMMIISYLPDCHIISTKINTYLWTRLTPEFVKCFINDLGWKVTPVINIYPGEKTKEDWFDHDSNKWKPINLLSDK